VTSFKLAGIDLDKPHAVVHNGRDYPGQATFSLAESCWDKPVVKL